MNIIEKVELEIVYMYYIRTMKQHFAERVSISTLVLFLLYQTQLLCYAVFILYMNKHICHNIKG